MTYYNWDHKDLGTSAFEDLPPLQDQPTPLPIDQSDRCPDGWLRYSDSCYFIETESLGFAKAERKCHDKQATLFVANSMEEWDAVRDHAEKSVLSWIGLVRFSHYERLEQLPRWQTTGSINPSKMWVFTKSSISLRIFQKIILQQLAHQTVQTSRQWMVIVCQLCCKLPVSNRSRICFVHLLLSVHYGVQINLRTQFNHSQR